jgi:protein-S-isoprenylcysteine O-methyltransferase Ste14
MVIVAVLFACFTVASLAFALWVSFDTEGGAIGQTPVLAYAVAVPLLATFALLFFDRAYPNWSVPWWACFAGFPIVVGLVGWLISAAGSIGERTHSRHEHKSR